MGADKAAGAPPGPVDLLVAGSGAAGLTAAVTGAVAGLRVLVCERAARIGGTTAFSGGRVWVPGHHRLDDPDADRTAAAEYLTAVIGHAYPSMVDAFLTSAPEMLRAVEAHTPHRFVPCWDYPDYHPDRPGARLGGRCLDMRPLPLPGLVPLVDKVPEPFGYLPMTHAEWERWRLPQHYDQQLLRRRRADRVVTGGPALTAALLDGAVRAGAEVRTGHRVRSATPGPDGTLEVHIDSTAGGFPVRARSLVLATGGYDQDPVLRRRLLPGGLGASGSSPGNTGDALTIAQQLGAQVDNLGEGWWMPMVPIPGEQVDGVAIGRALIRERGSPRQIIVDRSGRRFVDEAAPYHEIGRAMHRTDGAGRTPHAGAFLIVDDGFRQRYPLPEMPAGLPLPDWAVSAPTLVELAGRLGVDPDNLVDQVARWNRACADGEDPEFGRGGNPYDRYCGDPEQPGNPNLGPVDTPPYVGVPMVSGTIGSKGGPVTDVDGRVLDTGGSPVPGLYAVGNAGAFWTGDGYPGPGATLGVGMAFGYRAARAIAASRADA